MSSIFTHPISLNELGWKTFFQQQLTLDEYDGIVLGRIIAVDMSSAPNNKSSIWNLMFTILR
ncbi:hypothetical protein VTH8203_01571 [Vibrio thalassae]|uniref:Uncharacterized protein n=1 Tax=Vibrio thalassae TaxID=1243014 RepID=A0A240EHD8_9VIBR|nr:hypothetical protein VTH8203_01571 [Vibrio thalassae]